MTLLRNLPYTHPYRWDGREFGGGQLWRPSNLGSALALWLDAEDATSITLNGTTVSQWNDKSGNARHAVQGTAANQPTYTTSGLNGKPALTFDGSDDFFELPNSVAPSGANAVFTSCTPNHTSNPSVAIIARAYNWGSWQFLSTSTGTAARFGVGRSGIDEAQANIVGLTNATNKILTGVYDKTNVRLSVNGETFASSAAYTPDISHHPSDATSIGAFRTTGGALAGLYRGQIHEIIVMHSAPSQDQIDKVQGYLAWKWALEANLPVGHPFKSAPPFV